MYKTASFKILKNFLTLCFAVLNFFLISFFYSTQVFAYNRGNQGFSFDGVLYSDAGGTSVLLDASVSLRIQILNNAQDCILYEETQTVNTATTNGRFSIQVGSSTSAAKRGSNDVNNTMATVYSNAPTSISGKLVSSGGACAYTPQTADRRFLRLQFTPSFDAITRTINPYVSLDSVPSAVVAENATSIQGFSTSGLGAHF